MNKAIRYSTPVMVCRDDRGRLLGWWPDLTGRPFGAWLVLEDGRRLEDEEGVGLALFILYGAAPEGGYLSRNMVTPWGGSMLHRAPLLTFDQIIKPPAGVRT